MTSSAAADVSWLVSSLKQEIGDLDRRAVHAAKSQLDQAFKFFLTTAQEKNDDDYSRYSDSCHEVEQRLLNATEMIRELLGKLPEADHRPNELIVETIDLSGIDDDDDEQTMPIDELPLLQVDELDFESFAPNTAALDLPDSCIAIAQSLGSLPDFFTESEGLGDETDTQWPIEAPQEMVTSSFKSTTDSPGRRSNDSFKQHPAASQSDDESMSLVSSEQDEGEPISLSDFMGEESVEPPQDSQEPSLAKKPPQESSKPIGYDLSDEKVNAIFAKSCSVVNFATKLMLHLFSESELLACFNVYGRYRKQGADSLDTKRVEAIRRLVEQKSSDKKLWKRCIVTMNMKIWTIKDRAKNGRAKSAKPTSLKHPKISANIRNSPLYAQNSLSYEKINEIHRWSISLPHFAKNLMVHLFKTSELKQCVNVQGRSTIPNPSMGQKLDEKRVNLIRQIVEENSNFSPALWQRCLNAMKRKLNSLANPTTTSTINQ